MTIDYIGGLDDTRPFVMSNDNAAIETDGTGVTTSIGRSRVFVPNGRRLRVRGAAGGSPNPTFEWLKDGEVVSTLLTLTVNDFNEDDVGTYTFVASNRNGQDRKSIVARLAGKKEQEYYKPTEL